MREDEKYALSRTGLPNCYRMVIRYGYSESPMTQQLGRIVHDQLRDYIIHALRPGGSGAMRSSPAGIITGIPIDTATTTSSETPAAVEKEKSLSDEDQVTATAAAEDSGMLDSERARRLAALDAAYRTQVVFIVGKEDLVVPDKAYNFVRRGVLAAFLFLRESTGEKVASMKIPTDKLVEVGFIREI
jgi:KUP system potassium uptake protein